MMIGWSLHPADPTLDALIDAGKGLLETHPNYADAIATPAMEEQHEDAFYRWKLKCLYYIEKEFGMQGTFYREFNFKITHNSMRDVRNGVVILEAIRTRND